MKSTMNSRNIAKYHKLLEAEVPIKKISAFLKVDTKTLAKFTPEKIAASRKAKADAASKAPAADGKTSAAADKGK